VCGCRPTDLACRAQKGGHPKEPARAAAQGQLHVRVELAAAAAPGQRALGQPRHHAQLGRRRLLRLGAVRGRRPQLTRGCQLQRTLADTARPILHCLARDSGRHD